MIEIDNTSDNDLWVLSNQAVFHHDGARWDKVAGLALRKFAVVGPSDVWFGGYMGTVVQYDGATFETCSIDFARKQYWDVSSLAAWRGKV